MENDEVPNEITEHIEQAQAEINRAQAALAEALVHAPTQSQHWQTGSMLSGAYQMLESALVSARST